MLTSRRTLLKGLSALAASEVIPAMQAAPPVVKTRNVPAGIHFGAQTNAWAISPHNFSSLTGVLKQIHQIGYTGFETSFLNVEGQFSSAHEARRKIEKSGLTFVGVHIYLPHRLYDPSTNLPPAFVYERVAAGAHALGAKYLIFSGAPAQNAAELSRKIAGLNIAGKFSKKIGLPLAYHNETAEESESKLGELEALYDRADPEYVSFLLDCGHAYEGGTNVPAFLQKHHERVIGLHLRDYKNGKQVVLGQGTFPLAETADVLKQAHWKGWVENEEERLDGSKHGESYMRPAFLAMEEAFSA